MANYLTCAETAKLVRKALKTEFPGVKFSVRSKTYSMGASITVRWTDGPTVKEVKPTTAFFAGGGFDGTIDLAFHCYHWQLPDGTIQLGRSTGTEGSRGIYPRIESTKKPHPDAVEVSMGADYVFCEREQSRGLAQRVAQELHEKTGWPIPEMYDNPMSGAFKCDYTQLVPNSTTLLIADEYNRALWATSDYQKPCDC